MKIEHLAVWCRDLESMKEFYVHWFHAQAGEVYRNPTKGFRSYFLTFESGARLELMAQDQRNGKGWSPDGVGWAHVAFQLGSPEAVRGFVERFRREGLRIVSEARTTGDGYFEACVEDPEGNLVEVTA